MVIYGVVGNRGGYSMDFVFNKLDTFNIQKNDIIVSGGADGVDTFAQQYAKKKGCQIRILYPDPEKPSPERYFERNEQIAMMCEIMIAFDKGGSPSGTKNAINNAKKLGKIVHIIENGQTYDEV